jgi:ABC-type Fe3+/spermidine/putrescine transport system ATPase subunit
MAMLDLVGLADLARRGVGDLSGGERQRVALARSLAPRPRLLMLDEPLGALDRALRERLLVDIRNILKQLGTTAIFVTHDQSEALAVADRVAVMNAGRLIQVDTPEALYHHPDNVFVARFLGFDNLLAGEATADGGILTALGRLNPAVTPHLLRPGDPVSVVLRPEGARLVDGPAVETDDPQVSGRVVSRIFTGLHHRTIVEHSQAVRLTVLLSGENPPPAIGERVTLVLRSSAVTVIPGSVPNATEY